ncbi:hypothetical protein AGABI2DRAFT_229641 [Agaricus bisporus var. bisporus H97]|uniref:hypothetical protein n=1 Tax=Agaricus bisporus var. bisporus (strain H97 / ATCC MYA-4626 / FGSC 10389) TaxID=936046 RepID=UPI00029F61D1|nr:hypothetical protein AGABI2DRAFT_229641 [Agaricus bisporus var. bisporus H97]EKV42048.1 hypothetical protein AGABI2DRAFT_229641 [Agaricus bisporus var. bisporus H97]
MAIFNVVGLRSPRTFTGRLVALGAAVTTLILVYTYASPLSSFPNIIPNITYPKPTCSPESYSNGTWSFRPRTNQTSLTSKEDALMFAGFDGCASSREVDWHLAIDVGEKWDRFPDVSSWEWVPGETCQGLRQFDSAALVKELVEDGGWLLIGDSVTENHFFSISCSLYPHVIATPYYAPGSSWDRGWPQNLYLNPNSPIISSIAFPPGFNITGTPLVTFRRIDILFSKAELNALYHTNHPYFSPNDTLFGDEGVWTSPIREYLDLFFSPIPKGNYGTMIVSTGGHWTTRVFEYFLDKDKEDSGYGIDNVLEFFEFAMLQWTAEVQTEIWKEQKRLGVKSRTKAKKVVVRAYLPGHEDCHSFRKAWTEIEPFKWNWFNWGSIWDFNARFENILSLRKKYPDIYFLPIDRPARLRPDAHAAGDCLHYMTGAGVLEGWTHYLWHFISREVPKN